MNRCSLRAAARTILACGCVSLAATAWSMQSGSTPQGLPYVSGGVSHEELTALHARREGYSLWVITAALRTGAYLADVHVSIRDAGKRLVFDGVLDGPWLFIDLPLGRYDIEASFNAEVQKRTTTIHRGDHHQAFFYFNTGDAVSAEQVPPFERNPFDGTKK
jgi:hypothetical protein